MRGERNRLFQVCVCSLVVWASALLPPLYVLVSNVLVYPRFIPLPYQGHTIRTPLSMTVYTVIYSNNRLYICMCTLNGSCIIIVIIAVYIGGSPDTFSFPPRNHLMSPFSMSTSLTFSNSFIHLMRLRARSPQNLSGFVKLSWYRGPLRGSEWYNSSGYCTLSSPFSPMRGRLGSGALSIAVVSHQYRRLDLAMLNGVTTLVNEPRPFTQ